MGKKGIIGWVPLPITPDRMGTHPLAGNRIGPPSDLGRSGGLTSVQHSDSNYDYGPEDD